MIRSPLQHHRSRVPAIPPKAAKIIQTFEINTHDFKFGRSAEWDNCCQALLLNSAVAKPENLISSGLQQKLLDRGITYTVDRMPLAFKDEIVVTVTRPARISSKLLATFPWKLRRLQARP